MAYANWGATVYCDKVPRHENCDATLQQVLGKDKRYQNYLEHYIKQHETRKDITKDMCHAVVGDKESGVIVLLYKSYPWAVLNEKLEKIEWKPKCLDWDWYGSKELNIEVNDINITLTPTQEPEGVFCGFTDKKGRIWKAKSAYCYGEGHHEWG